MHHFPYTDGILHAESVSLEALAETVGTPFYCYSTATLERHYRVFAEAVGAPQARVFYAMKANGNLSVLSTLARLGAGADTVSEGEIRKAMAAGIPASRIVFSGVGKSDSELAYAVGIGIYQINIETEDELGALARIAAKLGRRQDCVLRINPDVGAGGHAKITTGSDGNKFGVSFDDAPRLFEAARAMPAVRLVGLACHIGSQIQRVGDFEAAFRRMAELATSLRAQGFAIERIDVGGGLGIPYEMEKAVDHGPDLIHAYAEMVRRVLDPLGVELGFEPGRLIVGNAGVLVTRVIRINRRKAKTFLVVDAAMNDLVRPAMYDAFHDIVKVRESASGARRAAYDVVGPVCETTDTFCTGRVLAETKVGDLIALMTAGAYGAAMASSYNARLLVPEVLVKGREFAIVRPRPSYEDLIGLDRLAKWL